MNPLDTITIIINGSRIQIGGPFPKPIKSLSISTLGIQISIQKSDGLKLRQWLNSITDQSECEYIEYQNILIPKSDIKEL